MAGTAREILDILINKQKITPENADSALVESINADRPIYEILERRHLVGLKDYVEARSISFGIPFISLQDKAIATDVISYIPEPVAKRYILVPFKYDPKNNELSVAMLDPLDIQIIEFLEKKSGKKIAPYTALKDEIIESIDKTYGQSLGTDVSAALKESTETEVKTFEAGKLDKVIREAPIAQIVSAVLEQAIRLRASDVHIEPQKRDTRVRYRVDGILQEKLTLPRRLHDAVISRIKILGNMKIDEKRIPQDGRFNFKMADQEVDLRVSSLPTVNGEKIVMRLLKKSGGVPLLTELGLRGLALNTLENNILRPHGIILVTGPTGSGKTTTLYAVLSKLNNARVNIVTLEDPVEYEIPGINQVHVNPVAHLTFASGLRSFLRQDPNIILVGEIRDSETTDLAIQASLTGHLVFSTLHTNNAAGAIPRLIDLGAEPFLVSSALNAVVGQRITRRVCPTCREEYDPDDAIKQDIRNVLGPLLPPEKPIKLFRGRSLTDSTQKCESCNSTGYLGRMGIFEVFAVTSAISALILRRATMQDIEKQALKDGMISMKQDGYLKALEGITTIEEVLRVAQD